MDKTQSHISSQQITKDNELKRPLLKKTESLTKLEIPSQNTTTNIQDKIEIIKKSFQTSRCFTKTESNLNKFFQLLPEI